MKLPKLCLLIVITLFVGCKNKSAKSDKIAKIDSSTISISPDLIGSYVGPFGKNRITLLITKVTGDSVAGRTVVGGNDRPFVGTVKKDSGIIKVEAKEPGDDKNDGMFNLSFDEKNKNILVGDWKPFVENKNSGAKNFTLNRKVFVYSKDVGIYPQASQRELKESDVNNLTKWELEVMRNEIFARHGYCFKKKNIRETLETQDWYVPNTVDVKDMLTDVEKKNVELIKKYEKYSDEYGDEYGR
ncbi:YARHG domain-containing protein [Ferruginibacter lapsinanis]|uniref:YARHG domain-containing protein n=1 Tax=Ferruginibacter lapsinanis TaxID=563172 RepID=UPI001E29E911|nr:YARHG domain-containing protein [Ferruginibacter lapsinanis]UEG50752.1 YARHG domain-containing protein [Ferruginibacter lapsinanis]